MKVRDIFQKKVNYLTPDTSLSEASKYIFGHKHKGLPVVINGKTKKLIGFITEQDILSRVFPDVRNLMEDYIHERDFEVMEARVKNVLSQKVKDAMCKKVVSIHIDDAVLKAESIMSVKSISRLPVVDSKGKLIGIITKGDIFKALVGTSWFKNKGIK